MLTRDRGDVSYGPESEGDASEGKGSFSIERTEFARVRLGGWRSLSSAPSAALGSVTIGATCSSQSNRNRRRERLICTSRSVCSTFTLGGSRGRRSEDHRGKRNIGVGYAPINIDTFSPSLPIEQPFTTPLHKRGAQYTCTKLACLEHVGLSLCQRIVIYARPHHQGWWRLSRQPASGDTPTPNPHKVFCCIWLCMTDALHIC